MNLFLFCVVFCQKLAMQTMSRKDFKQSLEIMVDLYIQGDLDPASTTWFGTFLNHSDSDYK